VLEHLPNEFNTFQVIRRNVNSEFVLCFLSFSNRGCSSSAAGWRSVHIGSQAHLILIRARIVILHTIVGNICDATDDINIASEFIDQKEHLSDTSEPSSIKSVHNFRTLNDLLLEELSDSLGLNPVALVAKDFFEPGEEFFLILVETACDE
jgi:hypothetical protein